MSGDGVSGAGVTPGDGVVPGDGVSHAIEAQQRSSSGQSTSKLHGASHLSASTKSMPQNDVLGKEFVGEFVAGVPAGFGVVGSVNGGSVGVSTDGAVG